MMNPARAAILAAAACLATTTAGSAPRTLVVCAPGYPGTTSEAQPTLDAFAKAAAKAAGWPEGGLAAVYHETADGGLARLRRDDAAFALVTFPFFLQHADELRLKPRLEVVRDGGAREVWSLIARRGRISGPGALAGWELASIAGYAPAFVRGPALGGWGALPESTRILFTTAVLSALRRASAGDHVAILADPTQASAIPSLPFAAELETVFRSTPLPGTLVCSVGDRAKGPEVEALVRALLHLHEDRDGAEALAAMQMTRFAPADLAAVEAARKAYAGAVGTTR